MTAKIYGWFDDANQTEPAYDPPYDAPCPYCGDPLRSDDVRTESLMMADGPQRSYFFRMHRTCDDAAPENERNAVSSAIFRLIEQELGSI